MSQAKQRFRKVSAFTLVEMLVVLVIIAILIGLMASLRAPKPGPNEASRTVAGMLSIAHSKAFATGLPTRVAICTDSTGEGRYLRYALTLLDADDDPNTVGWIISESKELPTGTIWWPNFSSAITATNTMQIDPDLRGLPQDGTSGIDFVYVEFDGLGEPVESGVQWVFARALPDESGSAPVIPETNDRDGFILRQTGRIAFFPSPDTILLP